MNKKNFLFKISVVLFLVFIFFSFLVAKERFTQIDFDTTVKLQDRIPRKFDGIFSLFSILGLFEVTSVVWLGILIFNFWKRHWLTIFSLMLFPLSQAIEVYGKLFVFHPAPPLFLYRGIFQFELPKYYVQTSFAYPSGHLTRTAFILFFFLTIAFFKYKKTKQLVIIISLLGLLFVMALSRVYLGEHWLSDVIGGTLLGSSFGIFSGLTLPFKKVTT